MKSSISSRRQKERLKGGVPAFVVGGYHRIRIFFRNTRFFYARHFLKGEGYWCGICETSYRRFLPDGSKLPVIEQFRIASAGYRPNCICPNCQSKDRDRLLRLFFNWRTGLLDGEPKTLLHFAPEPALKRFFQSLPYIRYRNVDLDPGHADEVMDITDIPLPGGGVDFIICNHVLEHVPDDAKAMRELHRVLKPGGNAILQVPLAINLEKTYENPAIVAAHERETHFGQHDHVRVYGNDYRQRLGNAGFRVNVISPTFFLKARDIKLQSLLREELIFWCVK